MPSSAEALAEKGYTIFAADDGIAAWARYARLAAPTVLEDPAYQHWWRHGRTWFVGVDALPSDENGALPGGPALQGDVITFIRNTLNFNGPWHRSQLSICYPNYPQRDPDESEAQHNFRIKRDAAHVDGLLAEGPQKRRFLREPHRFILGLPLNISSLDASPLVAWEGSHHIMREMFAAAFANVAPDAQGDVDVTDTYNKARARCFETCRRVVLHAKPGEAILLDRHVLHGVAPWGEKATAEGQARMIAYFRPIAP